MGRVLPCGWAIFFIRSELFKSWTLLLGRGLVVIAAGRFFYQIRVVLVVGTVAGAWVVVVAAVWFSLRVGRSLFHQIQTLRFPHV